MPTSLSYHSNGLRGYIVYDGQKTVGELVRMDEWSYWSVEIGSPVRRKLAKMLPNAKLTFERLYDELT